MTILTDRSQGGSSLADGSVELMVHRRCFDDDGFGVDESLNETGESGQGLVVRGKHWLLFSNPQKAAQLHRQYALEMFYQPIATFAELPGTFDDYKSKFNTILSGMKSPVPQNVNFLTVAQWQATSVLLRLEHFYQKDEDAELSRPATVSLKDHLAAFDILSVEELTLSAGSVLKNHSSTVSASSGRQRGGRHHYLVATDKNVDTTITLQPMQIRTFRCNVRNKMARKRNIIRQRFHRGDQDHRDEVDEMTAADEEGNERRVFL